MSACAINSIMPTRATWSARRSRTNPANYKTARIQFRKFRYAALRHSEFIAASRNPFMAI
jgi:hypothetical protein